jgi:7-carboxy-7-deazaguanine synthase
MRCTFVRLAGCPLNCAYCDTPQAIPRDSGDWMPIKTILDQVKQFANPLTLVTGGEPLAQRDCINLLEQLTKLDGIVQLETSGALPIARVPAAVRRIVDIKTPDSGESNRNLLQNLPLLKAGDELKFVICSRSDYEWSRQFVQHHGLGLNDIPVLFSATWGHLQARDLCQWILEDHLPVRMQVQLHKVIWGVEATGV